MAANTTFAFARKTSNLASSAFTTTGSSTSSTGKGAFPSNHCPNKLQLQRRLRESLGHGLPSTVTQRKLRAPVATMVPREVRDRALQIPLPYLLPSIPRPRCRSHWLSPPMINPGGRSSKRHAPHSLLRPSPLPQPQFAGEDLRGTITKHAPYSPIRSSPLQPQLEEDGVGSAFTEHAPHSSRLRPPPLPALPLADLSRPQGVRAGCRRTVRRGPEEDTIVIPSHLELNADSSSFCRTPGAPQGRKAFTQSGETSHAARIGLGLMVAGQSFLPVV